MLRSALAHLHSIGVLLEAAERDLEGVTSTPPPVPAAKIEILPREGLILGQRFRLNSSRPLNQTLMSQVWPAEQLITLETGIVKRPAVAKIIILENDERTKILQRFLDEVRTLALFNCPYICELYDAGCEPLFCWMVLEHMEGSDLGQYLREKGRVRPLTLLAQWLRQLLKAVAYAHKKGVLHRDIKPENILLNEDGDLKLCDFGIARPGDRTTNLTEPGNLVGTALYMSPEQARGEEINAASDTYSLGSTLYHLITGELPFPGSNLTTTIRLISQGIPAKSLAEIAPDVPLPLVQLVESMMAANHQDRPSAEDALQRLLAMKSQGLFVTDKLLTATTDG